jgi:mediator of RNA polymerase II transcription subunit 21
MASSLHTIKFRTSPSAPQGQTLLSSFRVKQEQDRAAAAASQNQSQSQSQAQSHSQPAIQPEDTQQAPLPEEVSHEELRSQIEELSHDLVQKEQQLETLIKALPGRGVSEEEQWDKMKALEKELEELEGERVEAVRQKEELLTKIDKGIMGVGV